MVQPKPISITHAATATGTEALGSPQPFVIIGEAPNSILTPAATVAAVATANATDLATAQALANANKTTLNALIASLKAAGFVATS